MSVCRNCGAEIDWITAQDGKRIPVDPAPVFVLERAGLDQFFDDMGAEITGRQARPEEECPELGVAFIPHWRTCPYAIRKGR